MANSHLIDVPLWDRAAWTGIVYAVYSEGPSALALVFENKAAGVEIFRKWRERIGPIDGEEALRISIIEGEVPGRQHGYSIQIGPRPESVAGRAGFLVSRWHRMNPPGGRSEHLERFKEAFAANGRYFLMPAALGRSGFEPELDYAIGKTRIEFRNVSEIPREGDIDSAVYAPDPPERDTFQ